MSEENRSIKKYLFIGFAASFLATAFVWVLFLFSVFGPDYFIEKSFPHKYVINSAEAAANDTRCLTEIGHLISKGIIVDVKEIWAFQGDYYSALITVLIAVLGLLGVVAFVYIKATSLDKVQESADKAAREATKQAIERFDFMDRINTKIDDDMAGYKEDIESQLTEIGNKLRAVETAVSTSDVSESDGADLDINPGGE